MGSNIDYCGAQCIKCRLEGEVTVDVGRDKHLKLNCNITNNYLQNGDKLKLFLIGKLCLKSLVPTAGYVDPLH